ncbi:MAG: tetratricopeptide repeat protein, partial [Thermoanaerobaculia bacterium]|nr:tetratricopeptide repeat protein [Thermoanaerobaculia bacterium]
AVKAGYPGYEQTEWARLQLGHLYERKGDLAAAEKQFQMCLAARENYPFALAALAGIEVKRGQYGKAETLLKQAMGIIPELGFYIDLVKIYQKTGRENEAKPLIQEIQDMMAEDMAAGHNMALEAGRFHLEVTKNLEKALQFTREEYQKRPANRDVNQLLADIYLAQGNKKQAKEHLQKTMIQG